jgi:predicted nucleotidyltransferase
MAAETILLRNRRDPLFGLAPAAFEAALKEALAGWVNSAWFFGSYGTPSFHADSDVDLLLVADTDRPFPLRNRDFEDLLDIIPTLDILLYTPDEFQQLTTDPSAGFWRSVTAGMRQIF